jgi:hypothetical protein
VSPYRRLRRRHREQRAFVEVGDEHVAVRQEGHAYVLDSLKKSEWQSADESLTILYAAKRGCRDSDLDVTRSKTVRTCSVDVPGTHGVGTSVVPMRFLCGRRSPWASTVGDETLYELTEPREIAAYY